MTSSSPSTPSSPSVWYAGIGSRSTPRHILHLIKHLARHLASQGHGLRSGHAPGADVSFEYGHHMHKPLSPIEIYLPWPSFNYSDQSHVATSGHTTEITPFAFSLARQNHPNYARLSDAVRRLMARNSHQILGPTPSSPPSSFIICWTPGGQSVGGTSQALRIAHRRGIPVINLGDPSWGFHLQPSDVPISSPLIQSTIEAIEATLAHYIQPPAHPDQPDLPFPHQDPVETPNA